MIRPPWRNHAQKTSDVDDLLEAERKLREVKAQRRAVEQQAKHLDHHRVVNSFTRKIRIAMGVENP